MGLETSSVGKGYPTLACRLDLAPSAISSNPQVSPRILQGFPPAVAPGPDPRAWVVQSPVPLPTSWDWTPGPCALE